MAASANESDSEYYVRCTNFVKGYCAPHNQPAIYHLH